MARVLHFSPDGHGETIACGAEVSLCEEYTDEQRYVDCKRCRRTKIFKNYDPAKFDVDVWNIEGDIVDHLRCVSIDEAEELRERYADDPTVSVVVTER